ncbi:MAG: NUDIX hydrolase N-terminal domain-containing protein [candidate division NC10 bacterium]|nr:NUDIX hydrolase N-terminal domain-containing protein [candidate division NC10 bacterium]
MDILPLLEELQALARTGINFTPNPYDRERYDRLLALATKYYGLVLDLPGDDVRKQLVGELGYITPKVGAHAALLDGNGQILLVRRTDDGKWCLPCGWVEPNESPEETVVRETREETGLEVHVTRLIGVYTRRANSGHGPHSAIAIGYLCETKGGSFCLSHEIRDIGYFRIEDITDWHEKHLEYARGARAAWKDAVD